MCGYHWMFLQPYHSPLGSKSESLGIPPRSRVRSVQESEL
jgi:hypothetical protein